MFNTTPNFGRLIFSLGDILVERTAEGKDRSALLSWGFLRFTLLTNQPLLIFYAALAGVYARTYPSDLKAAFLPFLVRNDPEYKIAYLKLAFDLNLARGLTENSETDEDLEMLNEV